MYTGPEVAPNGTWTVRPLPVCSGIEMLVPFVPEKTTCGVSMTTKLNVALTETTSPAIAAVGVIEFSTTGTRTVAVELPDFVGSWTLVAVTVTLAGFGSVAGAEYCPFDVIVP